MKKRRKSLLLRFSIAVFAVYIGATVIGLQAQINRKKAEIGRLSSKISEQEAKNEETQRVLNHKNEAQFIAEEARDAFNYALPGERVFVDAGD